MNEPSLEHLRDKLNELILKHNDLAAAVDNLCQAMDLINSAILSMGPKPEKPQDFDS